MNENLEFKIGVVTLAAIGFFIWMIVFVSGHNPLKSMDSYDVVFPEAGLLQKGDQVRLNGIPIGKVERISLSGAGKVIVRISIDSGIRIRKDARIVVGDVGLFGTNYIKISQYRTSKNPEYWAPNGVIKGSEEPGFEELLQQGQDLVVQAKNTFMSLNQILADESFHKDFKGLFRDLKEATESTRKMFDDTGRKVARILTDVSELSSKLRSDSNVAGDRVVSAMNRIDNILADLESLSRENKANVERAISSLTSLIERLDGKGKTAEDLREVVSNLRSMTSNLDEFVKELDDDGATARQVRKITRKAAEVTEDLAKVSGTVKEFVLDPKTKEDIRQAFADVNSLAKNIESATSAVGEVKFRLHAAVYYSGRLDDYRSDFLATVSKGPFLFRLGFEDVGESDTLNDVQVGYRRHGLTVRTGLIADEMGIGLDIPLKRDSFRLTLESFDPDDVVWRAIGSFRVLDDTRLAVWYRNGPGDSVTYCGVQKEF